MTNRFICDTGLPGGICHVLELLSRTPLRGATRLHVFAAVVPHPIPHPQPPIRLHLRLDHAEAESRRHCRRHRWQFVSGSCITVTVTTTTTTTGGSRHHRRHRRRSNLPLATYPNYFDCDEDVDGCFFTNFGFLRSSPWCCCCLVVPQAMQPLPAPTDDREAREREVAARK